MELDIIKCANCGNIDLLDEFHRFEADNNGHPTVEVMACQSCNYESDINDNTFELVSEKNISKSKLDLLRDKQRLFNMQNTPICSKDDSSVLPF